MSILLAILALGVLVIVHEAGHYFVARWCKMRVERFSVGFGPAILSWQSGETRFQIGPIPFGGFVQIVGMNPHEEFDPADPSVYPNRPTWQRFLTIFAGPAMNYVAAIVMVFVVFVVAGIETGTAWYLVDAVDQGKPAEGRLLPGDRLLEVSGQSIFASRADLPRPGLKEAIQTTQAGAGAPARPFRLTVLRNGERKELELTPAWNGKAGAEGAFAIGIALRTDRERREVSVLDAAGHAMAYPWVMSKVLLDGLYRVVTREVPGEVTGPVGITTAIKEHIEVGWIRALELLALLSVYLGLFNLLPLPALDGGRLAFLGYELTTRRRPNPRIEAAVHMVGFAALLILMVLVTFKDLKNLLS
ncbi:MAG: hypothetical protein EXR73_03645 [Myxococcales bacterium]|nr:hypothetical protein [Myxococcales bacterium]